MSKNWSYTSGDNWLICDRCSVKVKASKTKTEWTGFQVCDECFETRHPMDFIRARSDKITVPFMRPQPPEQFTDVSYAFLYVNDGYTETIGQGSTKQTYFIETD